MAFPLSVKDLLLGWWILDLAGAPNLMWPYLPGAICWGLWKERRIFDGAPFGNLGPVGYGFVMRDSQGNVILAKGGPLGRGNAIQAEVMSFLKGLLLLKMRGLS